MAPETSLLKTSCDITRDNHRLIVLIVQKAKMSEYLDYQGNLSL